MLRSRWFAGILSWAALFTWALPAQADDQQLLERLKADERRIAELEAARGATTQPAMTQPAATQPTTGPMPASQIPEVTWPVSGIYTTPDTKDLGALTGVPWLAGTKIRGWIDTNYIWNFNQPSRAVVDANQGLSTVKGHDVSVEGRTFDIHHNSFSLSLAELEIEKVPDLGGVGFKFDLAFGETQDIIVDTIRGRLGPSAPSDAVTDFDKVFQHASISYIAPVGNGVRFDVGKFVTHIGGETIETVKNWNYSHAFFYTYGIPFQDTGIEVSYPWSDTLYTAFYALNGWNVTIDNNEGKTFGPSIGWVPKPWLSITANYLGGPEQNNNNGNWRHLFDTQIILGPFDRWNFMLNYDLAYEQHAPIGATTRNTHWGGVTGFARYKVNDWFEPSFRVEYYGDPDGFTTGVAQDLVGLTLTGNIKIGIGKSKGSMVLLRPEVRYDHSSHDFFSHENRFRNRQDQVTLGVGITYLF